MTSSSSGASRRSANVLSDGREVWIYSKTTEQHTDSYYSDEQRQVKRVVTDKDGIKRTETITETYPVLQPATTTRSSCETRFVLARASSSR